MYWVFDASALISAQVYCRPSLGSVNEAAHALVVATEPDAILLRAIENLSVSTIVDRLGGPVCSGQTGILLMGR